MIHLKPLLSSAALLVFAQAAEAPLRFAPETGSTWTKTFTHATTIEGGELSVVMDGEEIPSEFLPQLDMTVATEAEVTLTDVYARVAEGRPLQLRRTYDTVSHSVMQSMDMGGYEGTEAQESEITGTSALAGETLEIAWDAEESEYSIELAEGSEADAALTEKLVEDTDLRGLLPEGDVSVGDAWTCDASALSAILVGPGGDLSIVFEGEGAGDYNKPTIDTKLEGEVELKYTGEQDLGGQTVAVVTIEADVRVEISTEGDLEQVPTIDGAATETSIYEYELKGELTWNAEAGYLVALDLEGDVLLEVMLVRDPDEPGPTFQSSVKLDGTAAFTVRAERAE